MSQVSVGLYYFAYNVDIFFSITDVPSKAASQGRLERETQRKQGTPTPACRALAGPCGHGEPAASWPVGLRERPVGQAGTQPGPAPRAACGVPRHRAEALPELSKGGENLKESPQTPANTSTISTKLPPVRRGSRRRVLSEVWFAGR